MTHDLKIGALVAATFLSAIAAAAAYRSSIDPSWQAVEMLPGQLGEGGDGFATPPPPVMPPATSVAAPKPAQPVDATPVAKKSVVVDPFAPPPAPFPSASKRSEPIEQTASRPPIPAAAQPAAKQTLTPPAPLPPPSDAVVSKPAVPAVLPLAEKPQVPTGSKPATPKEIAVPVVEAASAIEKSAPKPIALDEIKTPRRPVDLPVAPLSPSKIDSGPNSGVIETQDEPGNVVARSKPAPRNVEKTMKRPDSETPQLIASGGGPKSSTTATALSPSGRAPLAIASTVGAVASGKLASPEKATPESVDANVRTAGFDVVGNEPRGEEYVPVRKAPPEWSAVRAPVGSATGVVRQASWDTPSAPLKAIAAPLNTASVAVRSYEAQLYIVLDGDSYDRIAESMYRRRDLGPELARFNRARVASSAPLRVADRILLPDLSALLKDRRPSDLADSASPERGAVEAAKPAGLSAIVPPSPNVAAGGSLTGLDKAPTSDPKDRAGTIPIARPAIPGTLGAPPIVSAAAKSTERGIDPPPPTLRGGPATPPRELDASPSRDVRPAGGNATATGPTYTVRQSEETLYGIARRMLGDGRRFREIYELNTDRLANEYDLPVGVVLRLPADAIRR